ncbi:MAG: hypothetical protein A2Z20_01900, partial [Bdellovibrionales bacterium RBG_16_40_8]
CSSAEKINANSAEGAYKLALKYEKDERYEEAITYFSEVKNKYPYSHFAVDAKLKIGDIEFARENFVEAESAYKLFREFHPTHPRADYVIYRLGLSVYKQLPQTIDRDLKLAHIAIEHFDKVITKHPQSAFAKEALEYKKKCQQMLADKAYYIANFYFIRKKWESALGRFEDLIKNYPALGYDAKALWGASLSAYRAKDMDKSKTYFKRLLAEYPNSPELALARKELADGF